jgi:SAM-dependent methyltransferase
MSGKSNNLALALFSKSVMKQAKLKAILRFLPVTSRLTCLDIGGDNGVVSYFLRQHGGTWHSGDLTEEAVGSIRELVGDNCYLFDGGRTPFDDKVFDLVVVIDFLEHISDDKGFTTELARILKDGGLLVVNVPHRKKFSLIRPLRLLLGLTDEKHGHLRPGYNARELGELLSPRFVVTEQRTYSRFFSEFVDAALSFVFAAFGGGRGKKSAKGVIVTGRDVKKGGLYKVFAAAYPLIWLFTRLDSLVFFTRGYCLIVRAVKKPPGSTP